MLARQRVFATSSCELALGAGVIGEGKGLEGTKREEEGKNLSPSIRALPLSPPQSTEQTHGRAGQIMYPEFRGETTSHLE